MVKESELKPSVIDELQRRDAMNHERARTLLNQDELSAKDHAQARVLFKEFLEYRKLSSASDVPLKGVSIDALSKWISGKYEGDNDRVARAVLRAIDREFRGLDITLPFDYIDTRICKVIISVLKDAAAHRTATVICGPAGLGKTVGCKLAAHSVIPGGIHIECTQQSVKPGSFLRMLARRMSSPKTSGTLGEIEDKLIDHIRATSPFPIIDEGHYLSPECLNMLRDLLKQGEIGMGFAGTIDLDRKLDDDREFYGQWSRLIGFRYDIAEEMFATGRGFFSVEEMQAFTKARGHSCTPKAIEEILSHANYPGWGGLGQAANVLRKAELAAKGANIKPEHIQAAVNQSHGRSYASRNKARLNSMDQLVEERRSSMRRSA